MGGAGTNGLGGGNEFINLRAQLHSAGDVVELPGNLELAIVTPETDATNLGTLISDQAEANPKTYRQVYDQLLAQGKTATAPGDKILKFQGAHLAAKELHDVAAEKEAEALLKQVYQETGNIPGLLTIKMENQVESGDYKLALETALRLYRMFAEHPEAFNSKEDQEATLMEILAKVGDIALAAAKKAESQGDLDSAIKFLEGVAKHFPENSVVSQHLIRLYQLKAKVEFEALNLERSELARESLEWERRMYDEPAHESPNFGDGVVAGEGEPEDHEVLAGPARIAKELDKNAEQRADIVAGFSDTLDQLISKAHPEASPTEEALVRAISLSEVGANEEAVENFKIVLELLESDWSESGAPRKMGSTTDLDPASAEALELFQKAMVRHVVAVRLATLSLQDPEVYSSAEAEELLADSRAYLESIDVDLELLGEEQRGILRDARAHNTYLAYAFLKTSGGSTVELIEAEAAFQAEFEGAPEGSLTHNLLGRMALTQIEREIRTIKDPEAEGAFEGILAELEDLATEYKGDAYLATSFRYLKGELYFNEGGFSLASFAKERSIIENEYPDSMIAKLSKEDSRLSALRKVSPTLNPSTVNAEDYGAWTREAIAQSGETPAWLTGGLIVVGGVVGAFSAEAPYVMWGMGIGAATGAVTDRVIGVLTHLEEIDTAYRVGTSQFSAARATGEVLLLGAEVGMLIGAGYATTITRSFLGRLTGITTRRAMGFAAEPAAEVLSATGAASTRSAISWTGFAGGMALDAASNAVGYVTLETEVAGLRLVLTGDPKLSLDRERATRFIGIGMAFGFVSHGIGAGSRLVANSRFRLEPEFPHGLNSLRFRNASTGEIVVNQTPEGYRPLLINGRLVAFENPQGNFITYLPGAKGGVHASHLPNGQTVWVSDAGAVMKGTADVLGGASLYMAGTEAGDKVRPEGSRDLGRADDFLLKNLIVLGGMKVGQGLANRSLNVMAPGLNRTLLEQSIRESRDFAEAARTFNAAFENVGRGGGGPFNSGSMVPAGAISMGPMALRSYNPYRQPSRIDWTRSYYEGQGSSPTEGPGNGKAPQSESQDFSQIKPWGRFANVLWVGINFFEAVVSNFNYFLGKRTEKPVIKWFAKTIAKQNDETSMETMGKPLDEVVEESETVEGYFLRHFLPEIRPLDDSPNSLTGGNDGEVSTVGKIGPNGEVHEFGNLPSKTIHIPNPWHAFKHWLKTTLTGNAGEGKVHAKGQDWTVQEFVGRETDEYNDGDVLIAYLRPNNLHWMYAMDDFTAERITYIPGNLRPVKLETQVGEVNPVATNNVRVVVEGKDSEGNPVAYVMLTAMGVALVKTPWVNFEKRHPIGKNMKNQLMSWAYGLAGKTYNSGAKKEVWENVDGKWTLTSGGEKGKNIGEPVKDAPGAKLGKGDIIGGFGLGSTLGVVTGKGVGAKYEVKPGDVIYAKGKVGTKTPPDPAEVEASFGEGSEPPQGTSKAQDGLPLERHPVNEKVDLKDTQRGLEALRLREKFLRQQMAEAEMTRNVQDYMEAWRDLPECIAKIREAERVLNLWGVNKSKWVPSGVKVSPDSVSPFAPVPPSKGQPFKVIDGEGSGPLPLPKWVIDKLGFDPRREQGFIILGENGGSGSVPIIGPVE